MHFKTLCGAQGVVLQNILCKSENFIDTCVTVRKFHSQHVRPSVRWTNLKYTEHMGQIYILAFLQMLENFVQCCDFEIYQKWFAFQVFIF